MWRGEFVHFLINPSLFSYLSAAITPPLVSNSDQPERPSIKRPDKATTRPAVLRPPPKGAEGGGRTIDDDLIRPFPRPGNQQDTSINNNNNNNNFNFDDKNNNNGNNNDESNDRGNNNDKTNGNIHDIKDNDNDNTNGNIHDVDDRKTGDAKSDASDDASTAEMQTRQQAVRDGYLHAWRSYVRYAYGRDELQPPLHQGKDWLGNFPPLIFLFLIILINHQKWGSQLWIQSTLCG